MSIPGTFAVHLLSDGKIIARRVFFQSTEPRECCNCRERGLINLDFIVDFSTIQGHELGVAIEMLHQPDRVTSRFPLSSCGNPTVNIRLLLEE